MQLSASDFRKRIEWEGKIKACRLILPACEAESQADVVIRSYLSSLFRVRKLAAAGVLIWGESIFNPKPESVKKVWRALEQNAKVLVQGGSSVGKCLAKGTDVLMFDGSIKAVEDIEVGDLVMGDDSGPRMVLSLASGRSKMFQITPSKGEPWVCNEHHILTLKCSNNKRNGDGSISSNYRRGDVIDMPVSEYEKKSPTFKKRWKQFATGVFFEPQPVLFDPYIYGLWIGDGGTNQPVLHNADPVLIEAWSRYFTGLGYTIVLGGENEGPCRAYYCRNGANKPHPFKNFVRSSIRNGEKTIRREYLINSRNVRLELLAGIIDTDGTSEGSGYSVTTKHPSLARKIQYLARSLGFFSSLAAKLRKIKKRGFEGWYYNVYIGGGDCREIPTRLKKCSAPSARDGSCTAISVKEIPEDDYYGFSTDGNHRFLLGDFTVTHNSYTGIAWTQLDWWADPEFTTVKLISTTGGHTKANTYGTLVNLHRQAIIKMPGIVNTESITYAEDNKRASISIVRIREGEDNSEVLQGFHPIPRPVPHPIYGTHSRVRAALDECEGIPNGVWKGTDNMLGSVSGRHSVKVYGFYNPKDISSKTAQLAEPVGGWGEFDTDKGVRGKDEWVSRRGWTVVRIDPKKTENVIQRKEIFTGFQTYEGYRDYEKEESGNSLSYFTFGRGAYPPEGTVSTVIPQRILNAMRGEFIFVGATTNHGGADIAIDGRDRARFGSGRTGRANAMLKYDIELKEVRQRDGTLKEESIVKKRMIRFREEREVIQLDQLFSLPKGSPKIVADAIKAACIRLGIAPENMWLDCTGNGRPVLDYLQIDDVWSPYVKGIDFSKAPTQTKILEEDKQTCDEAYEGIWTEVWFALAKLAEAGYVAISPSVRAEDLERELIGRRYMASAGKKNGLVVEKKDIYKKRLGVSPDDADTLTIFVHGCRMSQKLQGTMTGHSKRKEPEEDPQLKNDPINHPQWFKDESDGPI